MRWRTKQQDNIFNKIKEKFIYTWITFLNVREYIELYGLSCSNIMPLNSMTWLTNSNCNDQKNVVKEQIIPILAHEIAHIAFAIEQPAVKLIWGVSEKFTNNIDCIPYYDPNPQNHYCSNDRGHYVENPDGLYTCSIMNQYDKPEGECNE